MCGFESNLDLSSPGVFFSRFSLFLHSAFSGLRKARLTIYVPFQEKPHVGGWRFCSGNCWFNFCVLAVSLHSCPNSFSYSAPIPHLTFHILVTDHRYFICYSSSMDTLCIQWVLCTWHFNAIYSSYWIIIIFPLFKCQSYKNVDS